LCWAHLLRGFNFVAESKGTAGQIGRGLLRLHKELFRSWHRVRDGTMSRQAFKQKVAPTRAACGGAGRARRLRAHRQPRGKAV
jgi:transposase